MTQHNKYVYPPSRAHNSNHNLSVMVGRGTSDFGEKRLLKNFGGFGHTPAYLSVVLIAIIK